MKKIKNVDIKQCVGMLIFSIFTICTIFIPFKFAGPDFAFNHLPVIGNGDIVTSQLSYTSSIFSMLKMSMPSIFETIANASIYIFYGIVLFDLLGALLLIIIRSSVLRIIFKVISIFAGFAMLLMFFVHLFYIFGFIAFIAENLNADINVLNLIQEGGLIFIVVLFLFSFLLISKQFKWFRRYY